MNDVDTIQKLESELEKLTAQKRTYEEKGRKYKEDTEQVNYDCYLCAFILKKCFQLLFLSLSWFESFYVTILFRGEAAGKEDSTYMLLEM